MLNSHSMRAPKTLRREATYFGHQVLYGCVHAHTRKLCLFVSVEAGRASNASNKIILGFRPFAFVPFWMIPGRARGHCRTATGRRHAHRGSAKPPILLGDGAAVF